MKFTWFNLMPWPYLPADFRDTHRSVWVDIPSRPYDPAKGHHVYHQYMDQLEHADALGFDGIGVNEHHQNGYGLMPSQKPHPPIYIPGGGSIETRDFCLDHDYNYSYVSFFGYVRAKALMQPEAFARVVAAFVG